MDNLKTVKGDLLYADVDMIVQQCNCLTKSAHGLSQSIKDTLNVDPYGHRRLLKGKRNCAIKEDQGKPGTAIVYDRGNLVKSPRYVACLFAQFSPGKPGVYHQDQLTKEVVTSVTDSSAQRLIWFKESLEDLKRFIETIMDNEDNTKTFKIAFPLYIGCGLAGGKWTDYQKALDLWATSFSSGSFQARNIEFTLVKKD